MKKRPKEIVQKPLKMITIQLNGESESLPEDSTIIDLLTRIGSDGKTVATLVNDQVVRPRNARHMLSVKVTGLKSLCLPAGDEQQKRMIPYLWTTCS